MSKIFHKIAAYAALVLLSALPLSGDLFKNAAEQTDPIVSSSTAKTADEAKRR